MGESELQKQGRYLRPNFIIFLLVMLLLSGVLIQPVWSEDRLVIPGVFFREHQLGRKGQAEVQVILDREEQKIKKQTVVCLFPDGSGEVLTSYGELGIGLDSAKIWQEAFNVGRTGRWWERLWTRWQVVRKGHRIPLYLKIAHNTFELKLKSLTHHLDVAPQDARLVIKPDDTTEIIPHKMGREVDIKAAGRALERMIQAEPGGEILLVLVFCDVQPGILESDVKGYRITGLISKFSTSFNPQRINRTSNIRLAAQTLNLCLIAPGEVFSFNRTVGPRTAEYGYNEADIIMQNELVPGIGGGVCQVSTTLYNAVLRAELEVVERHPHSMPVAYVEKGLDATVVYEGKDFKFRNNTTGHLIMKAMVSGGNITLKIYGVPTEKRIVLKSRIEREIPPGVVYRNDPAVPHGRYILEREGEPGYIVRVERFVYDQNGQLLRSGFISRDTYPPIDRIITTYTGSPLLLQPVASIPRPR